MGKLVLYLIDGSTMDVPLDKERLTIGRRPDNDVCLPYPAVSGEHAAVVTILADSFLEDLGSTNGTLVNGKAIAKHFLVDHDQIDIGRQRFVYMSDNDAKVDPLPPDVLRHQLRGLSEKVASARVLPQVGGQARPRATPRAFSLEAEIENGGRVPGESSVVRAAAARSNGGAGSSVAPVSMGAFERGDAAGDAGLLRRAAPSRLEGRATAEADGTSAAVPDTGAGGTAVQPVQAPATALPAASPRAPAPTVRVLSGPSTGRTLPLTKDELSIGRIGAQVAVVRRTPDGYRLVPLEGASPPKINGAAVAPGGSPLHPGDTFEIAGVRLELSVGALGPG